MDQKIVIAVELFFEALQAIIDTSTRLLIVDAISELGRVN